MSRYEYLIIGAGIAGHHAAVAVRERDPQGTIGVIGDEQHRPYNRPPLTKALLLQQMDPEKVFQEDSGFYEDKGIELITGAAAGELQSAGKKITLEDGREIGFGKLLLATGGRARTLDLPGADLRGVHTLRTLDDSLAVSSAAAEAKDAVVVGGGFIGAEVAASLAQRGLRVTMVFPERKMLERVFPEDFCEELHRLFEARGIEILCGDAPAAFEGGDALRRVRTKAGRAVDCGLAVVGIGITLNTGLATGAGIEISADRGIAVDGYLCSSAPGVWAAGDIASYPDPTFGRRLRVEHWDTARAQGAHAGSAMAGERTPYSTLPHFFTGLFDLHIQVHGSFSRDDFLRRGSPRERDVAYLSFRDGRLEGYVGLGRPREEAEAVKRLIRAKMPKAAAADALRENLSLEDLA